MIGVQGDTTSAVDHSSGVKGPQKLKYVVFTTTANPVNPNDALKSRGKKATSITNWPRRIRK